MIGRVPPHIAFHTGLRRRSDVQMDAVSGDLIAGRQVWQRQIASHGIASNVHLAV